MATTEPLVQDTELNGFRGAPFPSNVVEAAAESIRTDCEWHIAPSIQETLKVRGGGSVLLLPTLHLTAVASIVDNHGYLVEGWEFFEDGTIERHTGAFPRFVTVTFTHGYTQCPRELLQAIAERAASGAAGRIKSEALAGRSVALEGWYDPATEGALVKYRLSGRP